MNYKLLSIIIITTLSINFIGCGKNGVYVSSNPDKSVSKALQTIKGASNGTQVNDFLDTRSRGDIIACYKSNEKCQKIINRYNNYSASEIKRSSIKRDNLSSDIMQLTYLVPESQKSLERKKAKQIKKDKEMKILKVLSDNKCSISPNKEICQQYSYKLGSMDMPSDGSNMLFASSYCKTSIKNSFFTFPKVLQEYYFSGCMGQ